MATRIDQVSHMDPHWDAALPPRNYSSHPRHAPDGPVREAGKWAIGERDLMEIGLRAVEEHIQAAERRTAEAEARVAEAEVRAAEAEAKLLALRIGVNPQASPPRRTTDPNTVLLAVVLAAILLGGDRVLDLLRTALPFLVGLGLLGLLAWAWSGSWLALSRVLAQFFGQLPQFLLPGRGPGDSGPSSAQALANEAVGILKLALLCNAILSAVYFLGL